LPLSVYLYVHLYDQKVCVMLNSKKMCILGLYYSWCELVHLKLAPGYFNQTKISIKELMGLDFVKLAFLTKHMWGHLCFMDTYFSFF